MKAGEEAVSTRRSRSAEGPKAPSAIEAALRLLAHRDHSATELSARLTRKGYAGPEVQSAMASLRRSGLLDDASTASRLARGHLVSRRLGQRRIRRDLLTRGFSPEVARTAIETTLAESPEAEALDAVARAAWAQRPKDAPELRIRRIFALLVRRGFPSALVGDRLRALWPRLGEVLEGLDMEPEIPEVDPEVVPEVTLDRGTGPRRRRS